MVLTDGQWRTTIYGWVFMSSAMLAKAPMEHTAVKHPMELGILLIRE